MKIRGVPNSQIAENTQNVNKITIKPELIFTIRNWQNEMGFKENNGQFKNPDNLNNLNKNDIMQSSKIAKTNQGIFYSLTGKEIFASDNAIKHVLLVQLIVQKMRSVFTMKGCRNRLVKLYLIQNCLRMKMEFIKLMSK